LDGLLLIDKCSGPTSHDVVARMRQATRERSIGHTGTLDPLATGLLPLVFGRATRLASLIAGADKTYEASIRLGVSTSTDDADGDPIGDPSRTRPTAAELDAALASFRGTFAQVPPDHSAKRIAGQKAYDLARRAQPVELGPVLVTVRAIECTAHDGDVVSVRLVATAGFYVRALARDLGQRLGCGAHLVALRRTRSGVFDVSGALPIDQAERLGPAVATRLISPLEALPQLPVVHLTEAGLTRARHGNPLGPEHLTAGRLPPATLGVKVRIAGPGGELVALAESRGGALHPVVVLG
jgi:tRNA pseudouridine55 synthase